LGRVAFFFVLSLTCWWTGCSGPVGPPTSTRDEVRRLVVLPAGDQIAPNEILILRAVVVTGSGDTLDPGPIEWSSTNPAALRIVPDGRVVGGEPGTGLVIARTLGGSTAEIPVTVAPLRFSHIVVGNARTCALTVEGRAYCWGTGPWGLGIGITGSGTPFPFPERVVGGHLFTDLDGDAFRTCGLDQRGAIWCWGPFVDGSLRPVPLAAGPFVELSVGSIVCALTGSGRAWCTGQSGDPDVMKLVSDAPTLRSIAAGQRHACGLDGSGRAWCWGAGGRGQLGDGRLQDSEVPVRIAGNWLFSAIAAGGDNTCGIVLNMLLCWGTGSPPIIGSSFSVTPFTTVDMYSGGSGCAVVEEGLEWCWRSITPFSHQGQAFPPFPERLRSLAGWASHACGIDEMGRAWCWGENWSGQLGDGTTAPASTPVLVRDQAKFRF
jgi:alpha-tubulin suppressor-like RCC1 family protein